MHRRAVAATLAAAVGLAPVAVAPTVAAADPPLGPDTSVTSWDATATQAFSAAALTPAEGHTIFAYVFVAVYDAVMAVHPRYEPFLVDAHAPPGTSAEAAVAAAAHDVLVHYLPGQAASILDPAYTASLATVPAGPGKADGVALGQSVATQLIAERTGDGFRAPVTYTPPDPPVPGVWLPTAPTPPIGPYLGQVRPFALKSADQFRPAGPPALDTKKWARDYNEVTAIGSATSITRTPEQTVAARFWAEPPVQQARVSFRRFVTEHGLDIVQAARFMGMVSVTYADALIACFDAKYHYAFWRPITAIRAGHTDGNDATAADPAWAPLVGTPNHPEYPSAHACITPAGGIVISRFLGTGRIEFTVPSLTGLGDRHFTRVMDLEYDVSNARIWGGIHYRTAVQDGATIAKKTAHHVLAHHFRTVHG
jgi:hypothetical protein